MGSERPRNGVHRGGERVVVRTDLRTTGLIFPSSLLPLVLSLAREQEAGKGGSQWLPPIEEGWGEDIVLGLPLPLMHTK